MIKSITEFINKLRNIEVTKYIFFTIYLSSGQSIRTYLDESEYEDFCLIYEQNKEGRILTRTGVFRLKDVIGYTFE